MLLMNKPLKEKDDSAKRIGNNSEDELNRGKEDPRLLNKGQISSNHTTPTAPVKQEEGKKISSGFTFKKK